MRNTAKHLLLRAVARTFVLGLALLGVAGVAHAAPITVPAGLSYGDTYRLVFVTSITTDGTDTDIAYYNQFVTDVANAQTELAALATSWTAIISSTTVDARDNTGTVPFTDGAGIPIYLVDGATKVADSYADLWDGTIDNPIDVFETGATWTSADTVAAVWTGSNADGTAFAGRSVGDAIIEFGRINLGETDFHWAAAGTNTTNTQRRLYALSGEITVVPAPSAAAFLSIGCAAFAVRRRRRGRRRAS